MCITSLGWANTDIREDHYIGACDISDMAAVSEIRIWKLKLLKLSTGRQVDRISMICDDYSWDFDCDVARAQL